MTKRQLEGVERSVSEKNLQRDKDDLEYMEQVSLPKVELALQVAPIEYKYQLKELEKSKTKTLQTIEILKNSISTLEDQLTNGVEQKEITEKEE